MAGYWAGGNNNGTFLSTYSKLIFPTENIAAVSAKISVAKAWFSGAANSSSTGAGYVFAGYASTYTNVIEKLIYDGEVNSVLSAVTTSTSSYNTAVSNNGIAAYTNATSQFGGTSLNKLAFSGETISTVSAIISPNGRETSGMANSGTAAYFGGYVGGSTYYTRIAKLTFSADTTSAATGVLSAGRADMAAFANSGTAGYFAGGSGSGGFGTTTVDKFTFSTDTDSALGSTFTYGVNLSSGVSYNGTAGYFTASSATNPSNNLYKLLYSTDVISTLPATLPTTLYAAASHSYGL
jgi:hypothetical protein